MSKSQAGRVYRAHLLYENRLVEKIDQERQGRKFLVLKGGTRFVVTAIPGQPLCWKALPAA